MYHDRRGDVLVNEMDNLYNCQNNPSVRLIREKICFGHEPDNQLLISLWLNQENLFQQELENISQRRQHLEQQFRLLLDTIMDELIPSHWWCTCLDNIYYPLSSLKNWPVISSQNSIFNNLLMNCPLPVTMWRPV
jgi:hypothetical protein